jgi:hypothetical protein
LALHVARKRMRENAMRTSLSIGVVLVVLTATARTATATSLVLNGGFEAGSFSSWTATPGGITSFGVATSHPRSGSDAAFFAGVNFGLGNEDRISQSFATTPGQSYAIDFWVEQDVASCVPSGSCLANDFSAFWNGAPILSLVSAPAFGYTQYTFLQLATGNTSTISFAAANEPGFYRLDDVSVSQAPEPASLMLVGGGLAVCLGRLHRRRRQDAA